MDQSMENKCEDLMRNVVETRKKFTKLCVDLNNKTSVVENMILKCQIDKINHLRFKSKQPLSDINIDDMEKDADNYACEINQRQNKVKELWRRVENTQIVVSQLNKDSVTKKMLMPLTVEAMLARGRGRDNK